MFCWLKGQYFWSRYIKCKVSGKGDENLCLKLVFSATFYLRSHVALKICGEIGNCWFDCEHWLHRCRIVLYIWTGFCTPSQTFPSPVLSMSKSCILISDLHVIDMANPQQIRMLFSTTTWILIHVSSDAAWIDICGCHTCRSASSHRYIEGSFHIESTYRIDVELSQF